MADTQKIRPTMKQYHMMNYIAEFVGMHGYGPSYREIMMGCGYSSVATVAEHVNNLIARGHLRKRDRSARLLSTSTTLLRADTYANVIGRHARLKS